MQKSILAFLTTGAIAISTATLPVQADDDWRSFRRDDKRDQPRVQNRNYKRDHRREDSVDYKRENRADNWRNFRKFDKSHPVKSPPVKSPPIRSPIIHHGHSHTIPSHRIRRYHDVVILRPYGHLYSGYGFFFHDDDAYKWLAFTAIALKLLDNLDEQQQREHEAAQVRATTAPIGETIYWEDGDASGQVTPTREGTSSAGRYCREFQQEISIGGKKEQGHGTACRQPDGSWELISTGQ
jgi:hypothetical protein